MAAASISGVTVVNNPAPFTDPIVLEVTYDCLTHLCDDLEWKVIYVGSAESEEHDQVLDSAFVGPVVPGTFKFTMEAPAPDPDKIPAADIVGVTALLLTGSYKGKEFVRVGYYVNNEYPEGDEYHKADPQPNPPLIDRLERNILAAQPRVTKFAIPFDDDPAGMVAGTELDQENLQPGGEDGGLLGGGGAGDMELDAVKPHSQHPQQHQPFGLV